MAPFRTKGKELSRDGKERRVHKNKPRDLITLPGVQKIKSSLRQTRRLLAKDNLAADIRVETERRLKALEADLQKAELARKERTLATKYHKVKFFERQKVIRKIAQTKKQITSADGGTDHLESTLFDLRVDLNYILHYPKARKYISLFPPETRKGEPQAKSEATKTHIQRQEIRSWIRERMKANKLPAVPEDNTNLDAVGISQHSLHGSDGKKGKAPATKPTEEFEHDAFFGDDDEDEDEVSISDGEW